jgi:excisionase family DNA binding protein
MVIGEQYINLLNSSDVAHLLNIHVSTVRRWDKQGMIKSYRIGSRGDRRFEREEITRFLKQVNRNR